MVQLRCPNCTTLVLADPGETIRCPSCGFSAVAPAEPAPSPVASKTALPAGRPQQGAVAPTEDRNLLLRIPKASSRPPIQTAAAKEGQPLRVISVWAFILAFVALGTFHFARFGVPFALGATAAIMGVVSFAKNKQDRHGLVASILGCVSLAIGAVYLSLQ